MKKNGRKESRQLQKTFFFCTVGGVVLICALVAISSISAFYIQLQENEKKNLTSTYKIQEKSIQQHIIKLEDIALQITSRSQIRDALDAYNQGARDRESLISYTEPKLRDAMALGREIRGIMRFGAHRELLVQVGEKLEEAERFLPMEEEKKPKLFGPLRCHDQLCLVVAAPIINRQCMRSGTDVVLFGITELQWLIDEFATSGKSGKMVLAYAQGESVGLLSSSRGEPGYELAFTGSFPAHTLSAAFSGQSGINDVDGQVIMVYGPVEGKREWALIISIGKEILYANVKRYSAYLAAVIGFLVTIGSVGLFFLLQPLSGKIVIRQEVLEQEVREKTAFLHQELEERKKTERALAVSRQLLLTVLDGLEAIVYVCDLDTFEILFLNQYAKKIYGEVTGQKCWKAMRLSKGAPCTYCPKEKLLHTAVGQPHSITWVNFNELNQRWYENHDRMITWLDGRFVKLQVALDITERKESDEQLKEYAATQQNLLREVNHRVKNNLAAIIGMVHMEMDRAAELTSSDCRIILDDLVARIDGLARVHSLLSAGGWKPLPLHTLCVEIIQPVLQALPRDHAVRLSVSDKTIFIDSHQAHHLALVVNELATNAVKYALIDQQALDIDVSFEQENDGRIACVFRDNGPGFPDEILASGGKGQARIGLELVGGIMSASLQGELHLSNDHGAVVRFSFLNTLVEG